MFTRIKLTQKPSVPFGRALRTILVLCNDFLETPTAAFLAPAKPASMKFSWTALVFPVTLKGAEAF